MPNKVKHLRGTLDEWRESDAVIDDGEIALAITESGRYRMKIGNGRDKFSELEMFGGEVYNYHGHTGVLMRHCADVRLGEVAEITITIPSVIDDDYYALLTFDSGAIATEMNYPLGIRFTGDSVYNGNFIPEEEMHYTMIIWFDGELQCHVRGVPNA